MLHLILICNSVDFDKNYFSEYNFTFCLCFSSVRQAAAREWCLWEMSTSKLIPDTKYLDRADNLEFAAAFSR